MKPTKEELRDYVANGDRDKIDALLGEYACDRDDVGYVADTANKLAALIALDAVEVVVAFHINPKKGAKK